MRTPAPAASPASAAPPARPPAAASIDLLRWPVVGKLLRWRHLRTTTQIVLGLVALALVLHGLFGPQFAPKNLATTAAWIHYRGLLIGALLAIGNVFCGACPMILVRDLGRRVRRPTRRWPRALAFARGKWPAIVLFALVLFAYELFDLWAWPAATAWLIVGYFGVALLVDLTFTGAAFCTHVCPVGQFNFLASTLSPLELRVRSRETCTTCRTADCIKGRRDPVLPAVAQTMTVLQRGCELGLFLPTKVGNIDCTFCLDCVQACPHDNVAIGVRVPGEELVDDRRRSSIGRLSARTDLAALALLFTFGALVNSFAMIGPAYVVEERIAALMGVTSEAPVLGLMFVAGLIVVPLGLCAGAALLTRRLGGPSPFGVKETIVRFAYALVPFGVGVWLAHYGFHFLTGAGTILPVTQSAAIDLAGAAVLGEPDWRWLGLRSGVVFPLQIGAVMLGTMGAVILAGRIAERDYPERAGRAAAPWAVLIVGLAVLVLWILVHPMEMRGTGLAG
jgi:ferredoxin